MINKIKKLFITKEFMKFVVVGGINTVNHNIIYLICLSLKINYMTSNFTAFCISMIISFFLSCYFTFRVKPTWQRFITFPITNIPNLIFQTVGIYLIVQIIGIPKQFGALIATTLAIPFTFLIMRVIIKMDKIVFKKHLSDK